MKKKIPSFSFTFHDTHIKIGFGTTFPMNLVVNETTKKRIIYIDQCVEEIKRVWCFFLS